MNTPAALRELQNVNVNPRANLYFDGKCISHSLSLPDGSVKSVGVILPGTLTLSTQQPEIVECVAGSCDYKLAGSSSWASIASGQQFSVAANSSFEIRVAEPFHYICHFG
jgi:uncharacterized protein YaiE (UPF0345 family)